MKIKIAFTCKGGSGESTLAALFVGYLRTAGHRVLAVDADVNVHLAPLLGVPATPTTALSHPDNATAVRRHLLGSNPLIGGTDRFVSTTPARAGLETGHLGRRRPGAHSACDRPRRAHPRHARRHLRTGKIGSGCYHGHLAILENLLSHLSLGDGDWVVCDMVAGTDAFANSLHAQFDLIVVVVEPTPESVTVARRYQELATAADVADLVMFVGNKVVDGVDREYLRRELGTEPIATLPMQAGLRRARQAGACPDPGDLDNAGPLRLIADRARRVPAERRADLMRKLHLKVADKQWVRSAHGDITDQPGPVTV